MAPLHILLVPLLAAAFLATEPVEIIKSKGAPSLLKIHTQPGSQVKIEGGSNLHDWDLLEVRRADGDLLEYHDHLHGAEPPNRFYRITLSTGEPGRAPNFRLTDTANGSKELYYNAPDTALKGFVLIFSSVDCPAIASAAPALKTLHTQHRTTTPFWMINSEPGEPRSNLVAQVQAQGLPFPILHDRSQAVAEAYGVTKVPEIVVVRRSDLSIYYQGALDNGDNSGAFLAQVLTQLKADAPAPQITQPTRTGCELPEVHHHFEYATDIAPLLQQKCVTCHSPNNIAPFAMTDYATVKQYAPLMEQEILARRMPPWHADPEYGKFSNDISLSIEQEQKLLAWLRAGAPRGSGEDPLQNLPSPPPEWPVELGQPDMIIECPEQTIAPTGEEPYRYVFVDPKFTEDKFVRASIIKPSNRQVVHHYLVWEGESTQQMATGIATYVPGIVDRPFPAGTGLYLSAGSKLTFNLHYTPTGQPTTDRPRLGLWFHPTPPPKVLQTLPLLNNSFTIPANNPEHQVTASLPFRLPYSVTIYRVSPHMHVRGLRMRLEVEYLNGKREILLNVPKYEFHWQTGYYLEKPVTIPVGARIHVVGAFDNSALNPHNPNSNVPVRWGDQSWEEMFIGYFDYTVD